MWFQSAAARLTRGAAFSPTKMGRHLAVTAHRAFSGSRIRVVFDFALSTQSEALDERTVPVDVDIGQVSEKTTTLADQQKQATT